MNINVICVGKIKESYIKVGIEEFLKRLTPFCKLKVTELKENGDDLNREISIVKESEEIVKTLDKNRGYNILLDIDGHQYTSQEMGDMINKLGIKGISTINFIIGGSYGVSKDLKSQVDMRLSFSKLTFPHQLMRLIFMEQLYRWFGINNNIKYHK